MNFPQEGEGWDHSHWSSKNDEGKEVVQKLWEFFFVFARTYEIEQPFLTHKSAEV